MEERDKVMTAEEYYDTVEYMRPFTETNGTKIKTKYESIFEFAEAYHKAKLAEMMPTDEEIGNNSEDKEQYHFENMTIQFSDIVSTKFASICCGNSFEEGATWLKNKLTK